MKMIVAALLACIQLLSPVAACFGGVQGCSADVNLQSEQIVVRERVEQGGPARLVAQERNKRGPSEANEKAAVVQGAGDPKPDVSGGCAEKAAVAQVEARAEACQINEYSVSFVDFDGRVLDEQAVEHGAAAVAPSDPSRKGFSFCGWSGDFDCVTEDLEVAAVYEANSYTVAFVNYDGSEIAVAVYDYGDTVVVPADPSRTGDDKSVYVFTGWDSKVSAVCEGDTTYVATYAAKPKPCEYCEKDGHTAKYCSKRSVDNGAVGRWVVPAVGIDVACYDSMEQSVCDAKDSACYFAWRGLTVIGDHKNQGFGRIKKCEVGTVAYLNTGDGLQKYVCAGVIQGHNTGTELTDANYNSIAEMNPDGITCYTCNDCWKNVTIVFFAPVA